MNSLLPGISVTTLDPRYPPARVTTVKSHYRTARKGGSVFRITYLYVQASNLDQNYQYNAAPSANVYETTNGVVPPTGTYAATATRPYDKLTWGTNVMSTKYGWSNNSSLQLNYQRPFKNGYAYQIYYVYSKAFRAGGNTFRDSVLYPAELFAPGVLHQGLDRHYLNEPESIDFRTKGRHCDSVHATV